MICPYCWASRRSFCLSCGGSGFIHCCEGAVGGPYEDASQGKDFGISSHQPSMGANGPEGGLGANKGVDFVQSLVQACD